MDTVESRMTVLGGAGDVGMGDSYESVFHDILTQETNSLTNVCINLTGMISSVKFFYKAY